MRWLLNFTLALVLVATAVEAPAAAKENERSAKADSGKGEKKKDKGKGDKDKDKKEKEKGKSDAKAPASTEPGKLSVPILKDHDAKGLKIPYFDLEGNLQMTFSIGVASRIDENHVRMVDAVLETFDDDGRSEMTVQLPRSVLDLTTKVVTADAEVTIWRTDFELRGESMEFNTETRQGRLAGNVKMLIYELENEGSVAPSSVDTPE